MHTKTSEQILAPLADTVTQLFLFNEECERNGTFMPDLREVSKNVALQVDNMVNLGISMAQKSNDSTLKEQMPDACKQLHEAALELVESSNLLAKDGKDKSARNKLMKGTKGILDGTRLVLSVYDDSEVREIVALCQNCESELQKLEQQKEINIVVPIIRSSCQIIVDLAHRTNERSKELLIEDNSKRLDELTSNLSTLSPQLVSIMKMTLLNPQDLEATKSKNLIISELKEICQEILIIVTKNPTEDQSQPKKDIGEIDEQEYLQEILNAKKLTNEMSNLNNWISREGENIPSLPNWIKSTENNPQACPALEKEFNGEFEKLTKTVEYLDSKNENTKLLKRFERIKEKTYPKMAHALQSYGTLKAAGKDVSGAKQHLGTIVEEWESEVGKIQTELEPLVLPQNIPEVASNNLY